MTFNVTMIDVVQLLECWVNESRAQARERILKMAPSGWFENVLKAFEEELRRNPDIFWQSVDREVERSPGCWQYGFAGLPFPPLLVLDQVKTGAEVAYFLENDRWPVDLDTTCGSDWCVNPVHLAERTLSLSRVRQALEFRVLGHDEVIDLRRLRDEDRKKWTFDRLGERFGVHFTNAQDAYWGHGVYASKPS